MVWKKSVFILLLDSLNNPSVCPPGSVGKKSFSIVDGVQKSSGVPARAVWTSVLLLRGGNQKASVCPSGLFGKNVFLLWMAFRNP